MLSGSAAPQELASQKLLGVFGHDIDFDIHTITRSFSTEGCDLGGMGNHRDGETIVAGSTTVRLMPSTVTEPFSTRYRCRSAGTSTFRSGAG